MSTGKRDCRGELISVLSVKECDPDEICGSPRTTQGRHASSTHRYLALRQIKPQKPPLIRCHYRQAWALPGHQIPNPMPEVLPERGQVSTCLWLRPPLPSSTDRGVLELYPEEDDDLRHSVYSWGETAIGHPASRPWVLLASWKKAQRIAYRLCYVAKICNHKTLLRDCLYTCAFNGTSWPYQDYLRVGECELIPIKTVPFEATLHPWSSSLWQEYLPSQPRLVL